MSIGVVVGTDADSGRAKLESIGALRSSKVPSVDADVRDAGDYARHWCEVLCARREENGETIPRWVCARRQTARLVRLPEIIFGNRKRTTTADASSSMPYVVAFYHDLGARDVTRKYALAFSQALHHRTPDWKWWEKLRRSPSAASRRRGERLRAGDANAARACRRGGDVRDGREEFERARAEHDDGD